MIDSLIKEIINATDEESAKKVIMSINNETIDNIRVFIATEDKELRKFNLLRRLLPDNVSDDEILDKIKNIKNGQSSITA